MEVELLRTHSTATIEDLAYQERCYKRGAEVDVAIDVQKAGQCRGIVAC